MPLITCPDCQTEISDTASSCIKCGRPMGDDPDKDRKGFRKVEKIQKVEVVKPKKKLFSFWNIISVILVIFFVSLFASSSDDSSTSTTTSTTTSTADLQCLPVARSVIRSINSRAVWQDELDVDSGWAVEVKKYNGYFIAAKIRRPPESNGRIDIFYTDEISSAYTSSYLLATNRTAELAFPSSPVRNDIRALVVPVIRAEIVPEYKKTIQCARIMDNKE